MRYAVIITTFNGGGSHTHHLEFENGSAANDAVANLQALYRGTREVDALIAAVPLGLPHQPFTVEKQTVASRDR